MTEAEVGRGPAIVLWRASALPATVLSGLCVIASAPWGWPTAVSALLGATLVIGALSAGPGLLALTRTWSPPAVMASALAGYLLIVLALALCYALASGWDWLSGMHTGVTVVVVTVAWLTGQLRASSRLRILLYGSGTQGDQAAAQGGSPASPLSPLH